MAIFKYINQGEELYQFIKLFIFMKCLFLQLSSSLQVYLTWIFMNNKFKT